jgi:hypothetical protein
VRDHQTAIGCLLSRACNWTNSTIVVSQVALWQNGRKLNAKPNAKPNGATRPQTNANKPTKEGDVLDDLSTGLIGSVFGAMILE